MRNRAGKKSLTYEGGQTGKAAKKARLQILEKMLKVIPSPKTSLSPYAPKIEVVQIPVDKIGELIGPGGKVIKNIIAVTGAQVDVEDDGSVTITGVDPEGMQKAVDWVKSLNWELELGLMSELE